MYKEFEVVIDPRFYQYTEKHELSAMNTSELTICLSLARKEQRRLKEKCYYRGNMKKSNVDVLDLQDLEDVEIARNTIELLLFEKQGYVPPTITQKMIDSLISANKKTVKLFNEKG